MLKRGDLLRLEICGGGGWGDPLERDPEHVLSDVARGFITARAAAEDYGVVVDPATLDLDKTATDACSAAYAPLTLSPSGGDGIKRLPLPRRGRGAG